MAQKAQGAMEYLMSYGWAILVIMVVGVAMWQLGMFNMGSSVAPTSTGFSVFKPLLATCQLSKNVFQWDPTDRGFTCQFMNIYSKPLNIRSADVKIDGKNCPWILITRSQKYPGMGEYLVLSSGDENANYVNSGCSGPNCKNGLYVVPSNDYFFCRTTQSW
jgi:hypothetical protein